VFHPDSEESAMGRGRVCALALATVAVTGGCNRTGGASADASHSQKAPVEADVIAQAKLGAPVSIGTQGPASTLVARATFAPGADGGWHSHGGSVIVAVAKGTATFYDGDDPSCTPHRYRVGDALVEPPGHVHITRNEQKSPMELVVTYITPLGVASDAEAPRPGNCPF
jgi:quercetin dioxygenase-like cupin family protein